MICLLAYALKAIADTLTLITEPLGQLLGTLIVIGSLIDLILYVPKLTRIINLR